MGRAVTTRINAPRATARSPEIWDEIRAIIRAINRVMATATEVNIASDSGLATKTALAQLVSR